MFTYTEKLGLCHYTKGEGENKMILVSNTPPGAPQSSSSASSSTTITSSSSSSSSSGRRSRASSMSTVNPDLIPNWRSRSGSTDTQGEVISQPPMQGNPYRRPRRSSCPTLNIGSPAPLLQRKSSNGKS